MDQARSKGTLQSPHNTLTCFVARMIAPHSGQTYLMLRFLLVVWPPRIVGFGSSPSSLSSSVTLIWKAVLRLAVKSAMPGCWASHSAVSAVSSVKGTQYGVVTSKVSSWDEWGELLGVDYTGDGEAITAAFTVLKNGSSGAAVKTLQENLLRLGYALPRYGADGKFGSETEDAVKAFQKAHGLTVDGKYGEQTHVALMVALASTEDADGTPDQPPEDSPAPMQRKVVVVSEGGKVNIRRGHGTGYARISQVNPGTTYEYVATAANGWNAVVIGTQVGWVSGDYSRII